MARKRLGERLVGMGLITEPQLREALRAQQATGEQVGEVLVRLGHVTEDDLIRALCEDAAIPFLSQDDLRPDGSAVGTIPEDLARAHDALPIKQKDGRLHIALVDPFDIGAVVALERATGRPVTVAAAPRDRIRNAIDLMYRAGGAAEAPAGEASRRRPGASGSWSAPEGGAGTAGAVGVVDPDTHAPGPSEASGTAAQAVDEILGRAIVAAATDVHIEPCRDRVEVRYRVDGTLTSGPSYPASLQAPLVTRIKILSGLNIADSRTPQDGRFRYQAEGRDIDLRVSTFPTLYGEDVVVRVLDRGRISLKLERLGMVPEDVTLFRDALRRPHGLVPVTGPTGSGKTTTLYSALAEINTAEHCILTLEDPIEYEVAGIRQSQINVRAGLTFASGLRSLLRHDPDVILVGEMRDPETVNIALSAALTGHLVLTTLHTNTAAGAIPRLLDMGAEPFILASSLALVVAQRLVRSLCAECRVPAEVPDAVRRRLGLGDATLFGAQGCAACRQTGYSGRIGIFEMLPVAGGITEAIYERRSAEEIQRLSKRPTLFQDGLRKATAGLTSLDEVLRVIAA